MKISAALPKLPVCPYCGTIYRYNDVKKNALKRGIACYHCGRAIKISAARIIIIFLAIIAAAVLLNLLLLNTVKGISFIAIAASSAAAAAAGYLMVPYYISYRKAENDGGDKACDGKDKKKAKK